MTRITRRALLKGLEIGVDREELDPLDLGLDHPVDGVDAGAPDADHADHRVRDRDRDSERVADRIRARVHVFVGGPALTRALEDVLRDVGREGVAEALLGRGRRRGGRLGSRGGPAFALGSTRPFVGASPVGCARSRRYLPCSSISRLRVAAQSLSVALQSTA